MDSLPFSVVEAALCLGGVATLFWLIALKLHWRSLLRAAFFMGPFFLIALGLGQGAFPISLAPSAWRASLNRVFGTDSLGEPDFKAWAAEKEARLRNEFRWDGYEALSEAEALSVCDRNLDTVLKFLGLPPGRKVRSCKAMGTVTTSLGLVYDGPAFHDPFFGELGMAKPVDFPTSRHWRLIGVCHEAAHAKGFTRELDAELLTQLALSVAGRSDVRFRFLADIHFLQKTGLKVQWPDSLVEEARKAKMARGEAQRRQSVISFLRRLAERWHLRNSGGKYGDREEKEPWNPRHPFFAGLHRLEGGTWK